MELKAEKIINKVVQVLLFVLLFTLPFIHARFFEYFGIDLGLQVSGNFEFTKVVYFNIFSSIIILLYLVETILRSGKFKYPTKGENKLFYLLGFFWLILLISTVFSDSFFRSFFGDSSKHHGFLMWNNLIGMSFVFYNYITKQNIRNYIYAIIVAGFGVSLIGIKEFYYPTFNYGDLSNRLLGTFGHPNYLAGFLLLIIPYLVKELKAHKKGFLMIGYWALLAVILFAFLLTKSALGILLVVGFLFYYKYSRFTNKYIFYGSMMIAFLAILLGIYQFFPEKLHSFISRFYIWQTALQIIISDLKIFFIGTGVENLGLYFDSFKSPYLYLFENFGFTADRPHNIFLQFFIFFGIVGLLIISSIYYTIAKIANRENPISMGLVLIALFLLLNFASIASYVVISLFIVSSLKFSEDKHDITVYYHKYFRKFQHALVLSLVIIAMIGFHFSAKQYTAEIYAYKGDYELSAISFPFDSKYYYKLGEYEKGLKIEQFNSEEYYISKIIFTGDVIKGCDQLTKESPSAENYFYCGKILENFGHIEESINAYQKGLERLPDIWDKNSQYLENKVVEKFVDGKRFFSEKYSNINEVLEKVGSFGTENNKLKQ